MKQWFTSIRTNFRIQIVILASIVCFAVLSLYIGGHPSPDVKTYEAEMKAWKARVELVEQRNDSLRAANIRITTFVDSTQRVVHQRDQKIQTLQGTVSVLREKNDSILNSLALPDTCQIAIDLAKRFRAESDSNHKLFTLAHTNEQSLQSSVDSLRPANDRLVAQNDSLGLLLRKVPVYHEPKALGFIPLPSRTTAFTMGTVVGVVSTVAVWITLRH